MQKAIVKSKDGVFAYFFAKDIKDADIKTLQQVVIDYKVAEIIYSFARDIKGADIQALQQAVIDCKDPYYCNKFSMIPGADVKALAQAIKEVEENKNKKPADNFDDFINGLI